jgi:hypothetical protein
MNYETINWNPLFDRIATLLNLTKKQLGLRIQLDGKQPELLSNNIQPLCGPFAATCKSVEVGFFSFWRPTEQNPTMSGTVVLSYQSWERGGNSMTFLTFWYNETDGWTFESTQQCYEKYN